MTGTIFEEEVRLTKTPMEAAIKGRDRNKTLRKEWGEVKDDIMRRAVLEKFKQNDDAKKVLLKTGDQEIIEKTTKDYYWGCGTEGTGKNILGKILMEVRDTLKEQV